jgi:hypothetical protein
LGLSIVQAPFSVAVPILNVAIRNFFVAVRRREFNDAVTDVLGWAMVEDRQQPRATTPDSSLLFKVFVASFVPFMGFGFVDNFMMVRLPSNEMDQRSRRFWFFS